MHGTWIVIVSRLQGKPEFRDRKVMGRGPNPGEVFECRDADGKVVKARATNTHEDLPKGGTSLGTWTVWAEEIA